VSFHTYFVRLTISAHPSPLKNVPWSDTPRRDDFLRIGRSVLIFFAFVCVIQLDGNRTRET
jgi:hypothetical protein